ncbi:3-oxoadipate enol-lactonase [Sulfurisoma sediminicola]|uniref:3-oxoadipate enol-lactonase n=1 Tax=Sulfurisoma sediminicola TaxID=1381557 RepID=A0A497XKF7_9PROT|nr:3-oxoadipate enol-lactonase [Sulfurisoma sediminicola]RLJ67860.1 3-oxoadipate enol-lactonase [Sulfurisoma sediminicola]
MKIKANGIDIHYEISGKGPLVTLSHSLASDLTMWDGLAAALAGRYTVLRYDTRGHGATDAPDGPYSFAQLVGDVAGLLDQLSIERTHFVGLSMGGMIAQHFALAHPGRMDKLVVASSSSRTPPEARAIWDERIAVARAQGMQAHVEATLGRWFTASWRASHPEVMARIGALITATPVAGYAGCGAAICDLDLTDKLAAVRAPTLVLVGADDPGTPPASSEAIARAIPGARLEIVPAASHLLNIEQAATFNRLVGDFLG